MDDQRKASALTLAALQARGLGLSPVAGLLGSILSHLASQVPHLAIGGMAAENWFVCSFACF